jgi:hypothetical protein
MTTPPAACLGALCARRILLRAAARWQRRREAGDVHMLPDRRKLALLRSQLRGSDEVLGHSNVVRR